jgi:phage shock protein A
MNEGKLEMAMETVDMGEIKMEKRAEQIEAAELLKQFKVEWGMESKDLQSAPAEKTVGPAEVESSGTPTGSI